MDISHNIFVFLDTILRLLPTLWLINLVFHNHLRFSFLLTNIYATLFSLSIAGSVLYMFSPYNPFENWRFFFSVFVMLIGLALFRLTIKCSFFQILFTLFVVKSYSDNLTLFSGLFNALLIKHFNQTPYLNYLASQAIFLIFTYPLIWLFFTRVLQPVINLSDHLPFWRYLWIIPVSFYVIFRLGVYPAYSQPSISIDQNLFFLHCIWTIVTFLSYYMILRMLSSIAKNAQLHEELRISMLRTAMQEQQYERLQKEIEETLRARHDLRHHLLAIQGYAKLENFKAIELYLRDYFGTLRANEEDHICENKAVNDIVLHYARLARKENIYLRLSLYMPKCLSAVENDLCVLLATLFENAIEACALQTSNKRFIHVQAKTHQKTIVLTFKNSFAHKVQRKGDLFLSSKRPGEGLGIASMRSISDRYHGITKFSYGNGVFEASILLNITQSAAMQHDQSL